MARVVNVVSDLSGATEAQEVTFFVDGRKYVIALSNKEMYNFRRTYKAAMARLDKYVEAATDVTDGNKIKPKGRSLTSQAREWAFIKGYDVPLRGPLPQWVFDSYRTAQMNGEI